MRSEFTTRSDSYIVSSETLCEEIHYIEVKHYGIRLRTKKQYGRVLWGIAGATSRNLGEALEHFKGNSGNPMGCFKGI